MRLLKGLFEQNRRWAEELRAQQPDLFTTLSRQQAPAHMWIGCADSRVPANEIVGLMPGEMFVHRNVANVVAHTDLNCLSALQYAIDVLGVTHVIVCGHYGCGGVRAALRGERYGLVDNWLRHVRDVYVDHRAELEAIDDEDRRTDRLCELNVAEQVANVCFTTVVKDAWRRAHPVAVHGWIYRLEDGLLRDLDLCIAGPEDLDLITRVTGRLE